MSKPRRGINLHRGPETVVAPPPPPPQPQPENNVNDEQESETGIDEFDLQRLRRSSQVPSFDDDDDDSEVDDDGTGSETVVGDTAHLVRLLYQLPIDNKQLCTSLE